MAHTIADAVREQDLDPNPGNPCNPRPNFMRPPPNEKLFVTLLVFKILCKNSVSWAVFFAFLLF